jgi:C4-dicarboxylate-specific signal transduction histidine kinase
MPPDSGQLVRDASRYSSAELYAMLGELAAELAHELNQPLAAITAYADGAGRLLAQSQDPADLHRARQIIEAISGQALRAGDVIEQMRRLVRHEPGTIIRVSPNRIVRDLLVLVEPVLRHHGAELGLELVAELPVIRGDPVRLQQLLMILFRNAVDAIIQQPSGQRRVTFSTASRLDRVELAVTDTGPGVPEDAVPQLFQPFFTTKVGGTGLGLAAGRSIAAEHGGDLYFHNLPAGGARFWVELPVMHQTDTV